MLLFQFSAYIEVFFCLARSARIEAYVILPMQSALIHDCIRFVFGLPLILFKTGLVGFGHRRVSIKHLHALSLQAHLLSLGIGPCWCHEKEVLNNPFDIVI